MATSTARVGLRKPDGSDFVSRSLDLNGNWDTLDNHAGDFVCTSTTRPTGSNRFTGRTIFETDTNRRFIWDGSAWFGLGEHDWQSYTPAVTGGGSVTWTTRTGYWRYVGDKFVFFNIYLVVNAAGSGASLVNISAPTAMDRTTRQPIPTVIEGFWSSSASFAGFLIALTSGSGDTFDRLRIQDNSAVNRLVNVTGADLAAGGIIMASGHYREA